MNIENKHKPLRIWLDITPIYWLTPTSDPTPLSMTNTISRTVFIKAQKRKDELFVYSVDTQIEGKGTKRKRESKALRGGS